MTRAFLLSAILSLSLGTARAESTAREDLIDVLSSPELKEIEKELHGEGGDIGYHFVSAEWSGSMGHVNAVTESMEETAFVVRYAHNFSIGNFCKVAMTLRKVWLGKEPSKITKTISSVNNSCTRPSR